MEKTKSSTNIAQNGQVATLEKEADQIVFRTPCEDDGAEVWEMIKNIGVLDLNSSYSYLMWCKFFGNTSVVAEQDNKVVGFVSGFIKPSSPNVVFVWQVAVDASQRGKGLGKQLLYSLLESEACNDVCYLEATISPSNVPSQSLFRGLARDLNTECKVSECFTEEHFPGDEHEAEMTYKIGPF